MCLDGPDNLPTKDDALHFLDNFAQQLRDFDVLTVTSQDARVPRVLRLARHRAVADRERLGRIEWQEER